MDSIAHVHGVAIPGYSETESTEAHSVGSYISRSLFGLDGGDLATEDGQDGDRDGTSWKGHEDDFGAHVLADEILKVKSMELLKAQRAKHRSNGRDSPVRSISGDKEDQNEEDLFSDIPEPEDLRGADYRRLIITEPSVQASEEHVSSCRMLQKCLELRTV